MPSNYVETDEWVEYENGKDFKTRINLYDTVNKNERFYAGDQWNGVKANGLPTPVLNVIKRVVSHRISQVNSSPVKIIYSVDGMDMLGGEQELDPLRQSIDVLTEYASKNWERLKMDTINLQVLTDANISGDGIVYFRWNSTIDAGNGVKGDIDIERIDNVNYLPANPNDNRVQTQPCITLVFRDLVSKVQAEARTNGVSEDNIASIQSDEDYFYQSGDRSQIELTKSNKVTCLLKFWRVEETGLISYRKSTKFCNISNGDKETNRKLYPVAMMNWEERKNCCHGQSDITGLIPNQIAINKLAAALIMSTLNAGFPKLIVNRSVTQRPANLVGEVIEIEDGDLNNAMKYLTVGQSASEAYRLLDSMISYTKELMGASEVSLGEVRPDNTSAFIAVNQAASVPLESVKKRYYQYIEDIAHIWLDFFISNYNAPRNIIYKSNNQVQQASVNMALLEGIRFNVKVDVGPSTQFSEIASMQTLDNLLSKNLITLEQYLERVPKGTIPKLNELVLEVKQMKEMAEQQAQMMKQEQMNQQIPPM